VLAAFRRLVGSSQIVVLILSFMPVKVGGRINVPGGEDDRVRGLGPSFAFSGSCELSCRPS
jgi:hypothetical protein